VGGRTVRYVGINGATEGQPLRVDPQFVVEAWVRATPRIPAFVAVGMAERESNFTLNELDTEPSGFQSAGIFQLSWKERVRAARPEADLYNLDDSCAVLATLLEGYLDQIIETANDAYARGLGKPPIVNGAITDDVWPYVALTHNLGPGDPSNPNPGGAGTLPGIAHFGLDWPASFQNAHPSMGPQLAYGNAALSGGSQWRDEFASIVSPPGTAPAANAFRWRMVALAAAIGGATWWALEKGWLV